MISVYVNRFPFSFVVRSEIKTPDDLKGFKIRVPVSPLWTSMFKAFDAAPMSINFSEVYSALQTKVAEGQENPLSQTHTLRRLLDLDILDAQRTLNVAQLALIRNRQSLLSSSVDLMKALGGGWTTEIVRALVERGHAELVRPGEEASEKIIEFNGKKYHLELLNDQSLWDQAPIEPKTPPNPLKNDAEFSDDFPYLAKPW